MSEFNDHATFFTAGGTLPANAPSYVARAADQELMDNLQRGDLCYVLNARQMGKSSLCVRTRAALESEGIRTAFLDLQKFGSSATAEQWYRSLLERLGYDLKLRNAFLAYWRDNAERTPIDRLVGALRDVALEQVEGSVVVFVDEIDVVRDLAFPTDEFFAAIRACVNARTDDPVYRRLTFCILGTVAPTDLIKDVRLSPFNVGTRIRLNDFTPAEAAPLAGPLPGGPTTLDRVLHWTSGHPYLTQRLCAELTQEGSSNVDAAVARLFFAKSDAEVDENVKNVRNTALRLGGAESGFDRTDLLTRYEAVVRGRRVPDDDTDPVCTALRLSGLVTSRDALLHPRCRIYARVFDAAWVRANLPDAEVRRQRAAVAKARWQIGSIAAAVLTAMGALTWVAVGNAGHARSEAARANQEARKAKAAAKAEQSARAAESTARFDADRQRKVALAKATEAQRSAARAQVEARRAQTAQVTAQRQTKLAEEQTRLARRLTYFQFVGLARRALEDKNYALADQLLTGLRTAEHGMEWYYLNHLLHPEQIALWGHQNHVSAAAFSSDGRRIATSDDRTVRVWNVGTGASVQAFETEASATCVALSPDGKRVFAACPGAALRRWDVATGKEAPALRSRSDVIAAAFSPDGRRIAIAEVNGAMRVWDAETGQEVRALHQQGDPAYTLTFSPDGAYVAGGCADSTARQWEVSTGKEVQRFKGHSGAITSIRFSSDGRRILTGSEDRTARVWDVDTGKEVLVLRGHIDRITGVAFSPDGRRATTVSRDNTARVWSVAPFQILRPGEVQIIEPGQEIRRQSGYFGEAATLSGDARRLVTGSYGHFACVWDTAAEVMELPLRGHSAKVTAVAVSPRTGHIATASGDGTARLWNAVTGKETHRLIGHRGVVTSVAFSPDGRWIVTGGDDRTARIWDAETGREVLRLTGHRDGILSAAFSSDGKRIVTGSSDRTARLWDAGTGKEVRQLVGHERIVTSVRFSPDGRRVATASHDRTVRLWDVETGKETLRLQEDLGSVNGVAFSPDGARIATVSDEKATRVWDAHTGRHLLRLVRSSAGALAVAFSPDGRRIATGGYDQKARVWDAETGGEVLQIDGHSSSIVSLTFAAGGKQLVTGSYDETARIWPRTTHAADELERRQRAAEGIDALTTGSLDTLPGMLQRLPELAPDERRRLALTLNEAAWKVVDPDLPAPTARRARQARTVAKLAVAYSDSKNGLILDTLAAAHWACGDRDAAVGTQRRAVRLLPDNAELKAHLSRYENRKP